MFSVNISCTLKFKINLFIKFEYSSLLNENNLCIDYIVLYSCKRRYILSIECQYVLLYNNKRELGQVFTLSF